MKEQTGFVLNTKVLLGSVVVLLVGAIIAVNYGLVKTGKLAYDSSLAAGSGLLLAPKGGESLLRSRPFSIRWQIPTTVKTVDILAKWRPEGGCPQFSTNCPPGTRRLYPLLPIALNIPNSGNFDWSVGMPNGNFPTLPSGNYTMLIRGASKILSWKSNVFSDETACPFTIYSVPALPPPKGLAVIRPTTEVTSDVSPLIWIRGSIEPIRWKYPPFTKYVSIEAILSAGGIAATLAEDIPSAGDGDDDPCQQYRTTTELRGSFHWKVGKIAGGGDLPDGLYFIRVSDSRIIDNVDSSDGPIKIITP